MLVAVWSSWSHSKSSRGEHAARGLFCLIPILLICTCPLAAEPDAATLADTAAKYRREGNLRLAIELLEKACARTRPACPSRLLGELGVAYYQAHRLEPAQKTLEEAYADADSQAERALLANDLGNVFASGGQKDEATRYYTQAQAEAGGNQAIAVSAGLNLARLAPADQRLAQQTALFDRVQGVPDRRERARFFLNLGGQARSLGTPGVKLAYDSLYRARALAAQINDRWLLAEALNGLAQLYEDRGRSVDALRLTEDAVVQLSSMEAGELLIDLQWRRGRLLRDQGDNQAALEAYQSAVEHIEAIRQDIPIEYVDGRSSFRETLEPIYLGLADLLLQQATAAEGIQRTRLYGRARDALELIKQTELQDYLGDRCLVAGAHPLQGPSLPPGTAVLYPVILGNRLELLLETRLGIQTRQVQIDATALRSKSLQFARSVREAQSDYLIQGRELYNLLLKPLEPILTEQRIDVLVVVPDGPLRLIPFAALHDGERFAIAKFAIAIAPGLTIATSASGGNQASRILLAGLSEPGPVLDKLPMGTIDQLTRGEATRGTRSVDLKEGLALPGVTEEIQALKSATRSDRLLNSEFTVEHFRKLVTSGNYTMVHIASHAMFSQRAEASFILAYDDLLTIDELQNLLRSEQVQTNPIELLSLSACQTAEGDDRAPLGIAGAALRAHAASALGSLWSVDDEATKTLMVQFYGLLIKEKLSKAQALQRAQLELLENPSYGHPFYWAPFILVGSWQ